MDKINVKICTGTLCYVMGGAELQLLEEHIPPDMAPYVEISGTPCLDVCNTGGPLKAPFVQVGGELVSEATITKVLMEIKRQINGQGDNGGK